MCKCCEKIDFIKQLYKFNDEKGSKVKHKLKADITSVSMEGKTVRGTVTYASYDLKYCPSCGQKVR